MNQKLNTIIIIMLIFNTFVSFYLLNRVWSDDNNYSFNQWSKTIKEQPVPQVIQEIRAKNEKAKEEKPYLFMGPEEIAKYDCNSIEDSAEKAQCKDVSENYRLFQQMKNIKKEDLKNFDCSSLQEKDLLPKCELYINPVIPIINENPENPKSIALPEEAPKE